MNADPASRDDGNHRAGRPPAADEDCDAEPVDNQTRFMWRLLRVPCGYVIAVFAGFYVFALLFIMPGLLVTDGWGRSLADMAEITLLGPPFFALIFTVALGTNWWIVLPGALLAEIFSLRSCLFHVLNGAIATWAATLMYPPFFWHKVTVANPMGVILLATPSAIAAGFVYWWIAGSTAGLGRSTPPPAARGDAACVRTSN